MNYSVRKFTALLLALIMVLSVAPLDAVASVFSTYEANVVVDTSNSAHLTENFFTQSAKTPDGNTAGSVLVGTLREDSLLNGSTVEFGEAPAKRTLMKAAAPVSNKRIIARYNITVRNPDGSEWQPDQKSGETVDVRVTLNNPIKLEANSKLSLIHETDGQEVLATFHKNENNEMTGFDFEATGFSVYAVEEEIDDNVRINVKFMDGTAERATLIVKKSDTYDNADPDYSRVLYDPGVNDLNDSEVFRGWYTEDDPDTMLTIADIRTQVKTMFENGVTDGDEITYYAAVNKIIMVTYLNEKGTSLGSNSEEVPRNTEEITSSIDYTVNMIYTPADTTHDFDGWYVAKGLENIIEPDDVTETTVLANGTNITITGDVTFSVSSPAGHWLVFNENGKGATYNAPQFVKHNEVTQEPSLAMERNGYQFLGWYTDEACTDGNEFTFGGSLNDNIEIYAKWEANTTAGYTIIFWTQRTGGDTNREHYDVKESVFIPDGTVGDPIPYTYVGNGDEHYVTDANGKDHHYTGFYVTDPGQSVTITPEGDAILNLYYDRIKYNLKFYLYRQASNGRYSYANGSAAGQNVWGLASWHTRYPDNGDYITTVPTTTYGDLLSETVEGYTAYYFVLSAYYGENIRNSWPSYDQILAPAGTTGREPVSYIMMVGTALKERAYGDGRDTIKGQVSIMDENILGATNDANGNYVIVRFKTYHDWTYNIYVKGEAPNGEPTRTCPKNGETYYLLESVSSRSTNDDAGQQNAPAYAGYVALKRDNDPTKAYYEGNGYCNLNYYYDRLSYPIAYLDGIYINGYDVVQTDMTNRHYPESDPIDYGATIPDDDKNFIPEAPEGYVFEGWYVDETCQNPYTFTTMPLGGITVYAKWRKVQYRVFLDPDVPESDESLTWGSEGQEMNFRVNYGGSVSVPTGLRDDYELVGWYSQGSAFSEKTKLTDNNTIPYDKTTDFTDTMNKYGRGATTNGDLNRAWITRKLVLKAVWRAKIPGALGIKVVYDPSDYQDPANVGTNAPTDTRLYVDSAKAPTQGACTPPEGKVFSHWVLQTWNGSEYVDTSTNVYPGESFTVLKSDSKTLVTQWVNPNDEEDVLTIENPTPGATAPDEVHTTIKEASYTVRLRAAYKDPIEKPTVTIKWYSNFGDENDGKGELYRTDADKKINENVAIEGAKTREGYTFKGWTQTQGGTSATLAYNGSAFISGGKTVLNIAPDGSVEVEELFAVWEEDEVTINYEVASDSADMGKIITDVEKEVRTVNNSGGNVKISYSAGYAVSDEFDKCTMMDLFKKADERMFKEKKAYHRRRAFGG